ncbi:hypothetical protein K1T71_009952 [Dendrolimus kikuchii]|uniref:Uncharacterized protein n=1 Tax=Dendrolimus kikuchii TaxID=765133 RepID=A0ACC1CT72_9NEOP|nr:hypothetical protein K1T71_009952 [Dendrolimus kikuchii]
MKRRNAEAGKMRRPLKRTKITEGMYGNSMLYLKFVMLWATVVMADYILEFRFEFLWPFWMMLRSVYDSFKYQGLAFSVFFICIALTSDMICYFFIPLQYIFFAASTYVWVQYVWYTFADKGICVPTVAICCVVVYVESLVRGERGGELCRPLAAHCVGYPVVTLGFGVKSYVHHRLRLRTQRRVRIENEFYFQLMRDALPESALEQNQQVPTKEGERSTSTAGSECTPTPAQVPGANGGAQAHDSRHLNGSAVKRKGKPEANGHCHSGQEHAQLQIKLERLEKHLAQQTLARDKSQLAQTQTPAPAHAQTPAAHAQTQPGGAHAHQNGTVPHGGAHAPHDEDDRHEHCKASVKSSKYEKKETSTLKEEKRKNKNKDKDKDSADSHKSTEHAKEQLVKEVESTKEVKTKECNREKEKDRERETREREKEKEKERERERELREARECADELKRTKAELAAVRSSEAEAKRALQAAAAAERQRKADHHQLKQAHATLQHKVSAWRAGERATLERRLGEERRARSAAEHQLLRARNNANRTPNGECENEWCKSRRSAQEGEAATLRRDLQRARDREQSNSSENTLGGLGRWQALAERALHLERSLSAETRVKLDLLSALGDANRKMHIQEGLISRQEKEIEELKAQMLAVMPSEYVGVGPVCSIRVPDSPLDPNASVYTPAQLCTDA